MEIMDRETMETTIRRRPVTVLQLPEHLTAESEWNFLREVERHMSASRPFLVLDCSNIARLTKPMVYLLLRCLEEAIKRNGDVKLAGISLAGDSANGFGSANRIFEVFGTAEEAINSFYKYSLDADADADEAESAA
jgi:anti-anti-sigma regulatory factor